MCTDVSFLQEANLAVYIRGFWFYSDSSSQTITYHEYTPNIHAGGQPGSEHHGTCESLGSTSLIRSNKTLTLPLLQEANLAVSITVPVSLQNDPAALAAFTDDFKASLASYFGIPVSQVVISQVGEAES
jgi:hypothetical protein